MASDTRNFHEKYRKNTPSARNSGLPLENFPRKYPLENTEKFRPSGKSLKRAALTQHKCRHTLAVTYGSSSLATMPTHSPSAKRSLLWQWAPCVPAPTVAAAQWLLVLITVTTSLTSSHASNVQSLVAQIARCNRDVRCDSNRTPPNR